ncbi:hypothetical protein JOF28_001154 [Leucobacter exalbidus]|uniref:Lysoplasmalogenase n=1 Tax=Leucobacter exalbidus TaxID=662960 RepID=A0A940T394_9MICO|nr:lysoplasmalogenase family protein [Leucobacter exalbidus]MBP1325922.1 hypothetical protein [Leucobacter exalbidus]
MTLAVREAHATLGTRWNSAQATLGARLIPFAPYAVISVIHVAARFAEHPIDGPTKLLLMPALAAAVLWACAGLRARGAIALLITAILCSWLGDGAGTFFPMLPDELPAMLACFGVAHVAYLVLMWRGRGIAQRGFPVWALGYVLAYAALMATLLPRTGSLAAAVAVYGALLVGTAAVASRCGAVVAWGGAWFLVSDAILSLRFFAPEIMPDWTSGAVMLTYTLGQGLLGYGIVAALRRR